MAGRGAPTYLKRQKEQARAARAMAKRQARQARRENRGNESKPDDILEDMPGDPNQDPEAEGGVDSEPEPEENPPA